ncbi:MAG: hypothetical protein KGD64_04720 [Candidatus Heimdallarchaeota archaeon]|nr:hypothetical protein [Candidatus Heimdallarchaeota archaeon]
MKPGIEMYFDSIQIDWIFVIVATVILYSTYWIHLVPKHFNAPLWVIRKSLHIPVTVIVAFLPYFTENLFDYVLVVICLFSLLILSSLIPQIRLIQRIFDSGLREKEKGVILAINNILSVCSVVLILFLFHEELYIYTSAVLSMSIGDGMGEIIGRPLGKIKYKIFHEKSLEGSLAVLCGIMISLVIAFGINKLLTINIVWKLFVVSIIGTVVEALNYYGIDNTTLPLSVAFTLYLLSNI